MASETEISEGELITIATGFYSDYSVHGVWRAKKRFSPPEMIERYLTEHPAQRQRYAAETGTFLVWLSKQGVIEPINSREWHLGDNFESNLSDFTTTTAG